uniref:Putative secreted protein n=1 Tax=Ixodes ricinus TaxID=34613 RepID=A0A6B0U246_IXORI
MLLAGYILIFAGIYASITTARSDFKGCLLGHLARCQEGFAAVAVAVIKWMNRHKDVEIIHIKILSYLPF